MSEDHPNANAPQPQDDSVTEETFFMGGGVVADGQAWNEFVKITHGWWTAIGILLVVLGVLAILAPLVMGTAFVIVLGWLLIFGGIFQLVHAFGVKGAGNVTWQIVLGVIYVIAGIFILLNAMAALVALALVLSIFLLFNGIARIVFALEVKPARGWGWVMASGIAGVLLAILILLNWPGDALWIVGLLVGLDLLFAGASLLGLAGASRNIELPTKTEGTA